MFSLELFVCRLDRSTQTLVKNVRVISWKDLPRRDTSGPIVVRVYIGQRYSRRRCIDILAHISRRLEGRKSFCSDDEFGYWLYWHYYRFFAFSMYYCSSSYVSCHSLRMSCWNKRLLTSLTYIAQLLPIGLFFRLLCCYWLWRTVQGTVLPQQKIVEFLHPTLWVFIDKRIAKINRHIHVHRLQRCKF